MNHDFEEQTRTEYFYDGDYIENEVLVCLHCHNEYDEEYQLVKALKKECDFDFWDKTAPTYKKEYEPNVINEFYLERYKEYYEGCSMTWSRNIETVRLMGSRQPHYIETAPPTVTCDNCDRVVDHNSQCPNCKKFFLRFHEFKVNWAHINRLPNTRAKNEHRPDVF